MISRLFGNALQKVPSLLYQWPRTMKPQVVFVLGGPGAGKGTQCLKIVEVGRRLWKTIGKEGGGGHLSQNLMFRIQRVNVSDALRFTFPLNCAVYTA